MLESINSHKLKSLVNANIIDIRNPQKYNEGHILNAINIPYNELLIHFNIYLKKNKKYFIYCQRGFKSLQLCLFLKKNSFDVVNVDGGYDSWLLKE